MESLRTIWNLFLFFSLLSMPQLLGVLAYFRIVHYQRLLAHLVGFLIPPLLFFYLAWMLWLYLPRQAHADEGCGMAAVAAAFIVLAGTGAQLFTGLFAQLILHGLDKRRVTSN